MEYHAKLIPLPGNRQQHDQLTRTYLLLTTLVEDEGYTCLITTNDINKVLIEQRKNVGKANLICIELDPTFEEFFAEF